MPIAILPQSELKELFDYDPKTGVLTWRVRSRECFKTDRGCNIFNAQYSGKAAGYLDPDGYLRVRISGKLCFAHRIIYKRLYNKEPPEIDHINGVKYDNWDSNLRAVTHQTNCQNQKTPSNNTSGVMGVSWVRHVGKWQANIRIDGKQIYLGLFDDIENAEEARKSAEAKYGFHKNHGRDV